MNLPNQFDKILKKNQKIDGIVKYTLSQFENILKENKLYFFEEYTDHGYNHIESVLNSSIRIISADTVDNILNDDSYSVGIYILSVILHDIGMHLTVEGLFSLISGSNDDIRIKELDNKTWRELWNEYLDEARRFGEKEKNTIIGNPNWIYKTPELENKDKLTGEDKKLIGEFIRRHHPRIAHEISLKGFPVNNEYISFASELEFEIRNICGLIARSHGVNIRDTFEFLQEKYEDTWMRPYNIEIIFLMVILRIADYFQVDSSRTPDVAVKLKTFNSPISQIEHYKHLAVKYVQPFAKDPETLIMQCEPQNSFIYIKLKELFGDIQKELDTSWAVLGEVYGKESPDMQPKLAFRRIKSNIDNSEKFAKSINYIPEKIKFNVSNELPKLLIGPLYGNDPTFGIRELLQNAVDSCREREFLEKSGFKAKVKITFYKEHKKLFFKIEDNGLGMNLSTLKNYFLEVGSSLRKSSYWKKTFSDDHGDSKIQRSGKFGIGVLASFLIGETIYLETRESNSNSGYSFSTDLNSEQIEIIKIEKENVGTTIIIEIDEDTIEKLINSSYPFYNWYFLDTPAVEYIDLLGKFTDISQHTVTPGYNDNLAEYWRELNIEGYNKIIWTYDKSIIKNLDGCFINNGILIPEVNNFHKEYYDRDRGIFIRELVMPFISVFDFNGSLPLNLSRNNIDNGIIPFQTELLIEIYKDIIAKLITEEIKFPFVKDNVIERKIFNHPAIGMLNVIFSKEGFIIDHYTFTQNIKNKTLLEFSPKQDTDSIVNFDIKDAFVLIRERRNIPMTEFQYGVNIYSYNCGAKMYINKGMYEKLFDDKYNRYPLTVRKKHKIINSNDESVELRYLYSNDKFSLDEMSLNLNLCNYIIESDLSVINYRNSIKSIEIFSQLLEKYFKDTNFIIPYDFKQRQNKFPFLFEELETYITKFITLYR